ncbi:MAG: ABC transporter permease [Caulobacterales bacterium]
MSLALATVIYEWRRYLAAVIALAFSGLLVLAQMGLLGGIVHAATATIERSRADLMILAPKTDSLVNSNNGIPARVKPLIYLNPEVVEAASLTGDGGQWTSIPKPGETRKQLFVQIRGVDTEPNAVALPTDYPESVRLALLEPRAVAVDKSALGQLGVKLGDKAVLNGHTVVLRAVLQNYPNINNVDVIMSRASLRALGMGESGPQIGPLLVRIRDPARAEAVVNDLNARSNGAYRAWTKPALSRANEDSLMKEQIVGVLLGFSVVLGIGIGIGITSQTLRGAILANIKEFASLRALGVSVGSLRLVVLELSAWVGVAGLATTALFTFLITFAANAVGLPMAFQPPSVIEVAIMLVVIAMLSGAMSLGILKRSQPADLLR